jgi:hypothetical protein
MTHRHKWVEMSGHSWVDEFGLELPEIEIELCTDCGQVRSKIGLDSEKKTDRIKRKR